MGEEWLYSQQYTTFDCSCVLFITTIHKTIIIIILETELRHHIIVLWLSRLFVDSEFWFRLYPPPIAIVTSYIVFFGILYCQCIHIGLLLDWAYLIFLHCVLQLVDCCLIYLVLLWKGYHVLVRPLDYRLDIDLFYTLFIV